MAEHYLQIMKKKKHEFTLIMFYKRRPIRMGAKSLCVHKATHNLAHKSDCNIKIFLRCYDDDVQFSIHRRKWS